MIPKNIMRSAVAAAMATLMSSGQLSAVAGSLTKEQESQLQAIAYSATLAKFVSTNSQAFVSALAPAMRERWQKDELSLRVEGVQFFLPDFFRVAYTYNGSVVGDAFCFGLYNPFYDYMLLCKAENLEYTVIVDYKWVAGSALRRGVAASKYPSAVGVNPADDYFPVLLKTAGEVITEFNKIFVGTPPDKSFAVLPAIDKAGVERLLDIAKLRTAQAVKMTGDASAYGVATLSAAVLADEKLASQPFVAKDKGTQATINTLSGMPTEMRKSFRAVGYFESDGEKCIVFYNTSMPTFLVLARSRDGNTIQFGMFDMRIADGWEKNINR